MQSKISCFNQTLFRKNLTRFWPLWVVASFLAALAPLAVLLEQVQTGFVYFASPAEVKRVLYDVLVHGGPVILLIYSVLCALAVWSFLYNARSTSLMHTLPITRKGIFLTNFLSGMTMILIPCGVAGVLTILVTGLSGGFTVEGFGVTILGVAGMAVFYYSSATAVAFVTGNVFAMPVLYFVFHFLAPILDFLLSTLAEGFFFGYRSNYTGAADFLSPTVYMMSNLGVKNEYREIYDAANDWYDHELIASTLENGWIIAVYALVGLVLLGLAWMLYSRRRSESAGDVVSVGWMKPVFRYGVTICAAISGGQLLYIIFWGNYHYGSYYDVLPLGICMVLAGLIGYFAASMLLAKSLRVFRRSLPGAALTVVAVAALCLGYDADILGVEDRVPPLGEVETVSFSINSTGWAGGDTEDPAAINKLMDAHRAILAEKETFLRNEENSFWEETVGYTNFRLTYYLQDGTRVDRRYQLDYPISDVTTPGTAMYELARLVTEPEIQRANLVPQDLDHFLSGEIFVTNTVTGEIENVVLDAAQTERLYEAVLLDLEAGHFGHTMFLEDEAHEQLIFDDPIYLYYVAKDGNGDSYNNSVDVSISTYCTETIAALQAMGLVNDQYTMRTRGETLGYEAVEKWAEPYLEESTSAVIGGADGPTAVMVSGVITG